jgi:hypothetical protein
MNEIPIKAMVLTRSALLVAAKLTCEGIAAGDAPKRRRKERRGKP